VYELLNNASKHAFGTGNGAIRVEILREDNHVSCSVTDDENAALSASPGRGSQIVDALAKHLGGAMSRRFGTHGTKATLRFPHERKLTPNSVTPELAGRIGELSPAHRSRDQFDRTSV